MATPRLIQLAQGAIREGVKRHEKAVDAVAQELRKPVTSSAPAAVNAYSSLFSSGNVPLTDAVSGSPHYLAYRQVSLPDAGSSIGARLAGDMTQAANLVGVPVYTAETDHTVHLLDALRNQARRGEQVYDQTPHVDEDEKPSADTQVVEAFARSLAAVRVGPATALEIGAATGLIVAGKFIKFRRDFEGVTGSAALSGSIGTEVRGALRASVSPAAATAEFSAAGGGFAGARASASARIERPGGFLEVRADVLAGIGGGASTQAKIEGGVASFNVHVGASAPLGVAFSAGGQIEYQRLTASVFQAGQKTREAVDAWFRRPDRAT
jgi:hypothetical protein